MLTAPGYRKGSGMHNNIEQHRCVYMKTVCLRQIACGFTARRVSTRLSAGDTLWVNII